MSGTLVERDQVSVIIPTLGRPAELAETVQRLAKCTKGIVGECIIVWDSALPPDLSQLFDAAESFPIRAIWPGRHVGVWFARNFGAGEARCPHLVFLDDDIEVSESWNAAIEQIVDEAWLAATGPVLPKNDSLLSRARAVRNQMRYSGVQHMGDVSFMSGGNSAVSAEAFLLVGGFRDSGTGSDNEFARRLSELGTTCQFHGGLVVLHEHDRGTRTAFAAAYLSGLRDAQRGFSVGHCFLGPGVGRRELLVRIVNGCLWTTRLAGHLRGSLLTVRAVRPTKSDSTVRQQKV